VTDEGLRKACGIAVAALFFVIGIVRALAGKGPEEVTPFSRDPNAGFKSPTIFGISVAWDFAIGLAFLICTLWFL